MSRIYKKHLTMLQTPLGMRSVYDSVSFCNRCGLCASACPSYNLNPKESNSPRARNQALRLLLEEKLKVKQMRNSWEELVTSCSLCGRCEQACPGQIPTGQHVLELRRKLHLHLLPTTLFALLRCRENSPTIFYFLIRMGLLLRKTGLLHLISLLPGFTWLEHVLEILPVQNGAPFKKNNPTRPTLIYLPSLEAQFLLPSLAQRVYQLASKKHRVYVWNNTACGLFEYMFGDLQRARSIVRSLIVRHEKTANGKLPLLTDSLDVYLFLKQAPQLFSGFSAWEEKAARFAENICFVTEFLPKRPSAIRQWEKPVLLMSAMLSGALSPVQSDVLKILQTLFKKNFVECGYKDVCVAPAAYAFIRNSHAKAYNLQAVRTVAQYQAQSVVVLSGLAELETNFYLHRFYPSAKAHHIARLNG